MSNPVISGEAVLNIQQWMDSLQQILTGTQNTTRSLQSAGQAAQQAGDQIAAGLKKPVDQLKALEYELQQVQRAFNPIFRIGAQLSQVSIGIGILSGGLLTMLGHLRSGAEAWDYWIAKTEAAMASSDRLGTSLQRTQQQSDQLRQAVGLLAEELGAVTPEQVAQGFYFLQSATGANIESFNQLANASANLKQIFQAVIIGNADLEKTIKGVVNAAKEFGLEMSQLGYVAQTFTQIANITTAEVSDLIESFRFVGPIAKSMGESFESVILTLGEVAEFGIKGSQAGRALRQEFINLLEPSKKADQALQEVLVTSQGLSGSWRDLVFPNGQFIGSAHYVELLANSLASASQFNQNFALAVQASANELPFLSALTQQAIADVQRYGSVQDATRAKLAQASDALAEYRQMLEEVKAGHMDLAEVQQRIAQRFDETSGTFANSMKVAWGQASNAIQNALNDIGLVAQKALLPVLQLAGGAITLLRNWVRQNQDTAESLIRTIAIMAAFGTAFATVGLAVGTLMNSVAALGNFFGGFALAIRIVLTQLAPLAPLVLVLVAATGALVVAWNQGWFGMREATETAGQGIRDVLNLTLDGLTQLATLVVALLRGDWTTAWNSLKVVAEDALLGVITLVKDVGGQLAIVLVNALKEAVVKVDEVTGGFATAGVKLVETFAGGIVAGARAVLIPAMTAVGNLIAGFLKGNSPPAEGPLSTIDQWGAKVFDAYLSGFAGADVDSHMERATAGIAAYLEGQSPPAQGRLAQIATWGQSVFQSYLEGFKKADFQVLDEVTGLIEKQLQGMLEDKTLSPDQFFATIMQAREAVASMIQTIRQGGEVSGEVFQRIRDLSGEIGNSVERLVRAMAELIPIQDEIARREQTILQAERDRLEPIRQARQELALQKAELDHQKEPYLQERDRIANAATDLADRQADLRDTRSGLADRQAGVRDRRGDLADRQAGLRDERSDLSDRRSQVQDQVANLADQKAAIDEENKGYEYQRELIHQKNLELELAKVPLDEEKRALEEIKAGYAEQARSIQERRYALEDEKRPFEEQKTLLEEQKLPYQQILDAIKDRIADTRLLVDLEKDQLDSIKLRKSALEDELSAKKNVNQETKAGRDQDLEGLKAQVDKVKEEEKAEEEAWQRRKNRGKDGLTPLTLAEMLAQQARNNAIIGSSTDGNLNDMGVFGGADEETSIPFGKHARKTTREERREIRHPELAGLEAEYAARKRNNKLAEEQASAAERELKARIDAVTTEERPHQAKMAEYEASIRASEASTRDPQHNLDLIARQQRVIDAQLAGFEPRERALKLEQENLGRQEFVTQGEQARLDAKYRNLQQESENLRIQDLGWDREMERLRLQKTVLDLQQIVFDRQLRDFGREERGLSGRERDLNKEGRGLEGEERGLEAEGRTLGGAERSLEGEVRDNQGANRLNQRGLREFTPQEQALGAQGRDLDYQESLAQAYLQAMRADLAQYKDDVLKPAEELVAQARGLVAEEGKTLELAKAAVRAAKQNELPSQDGPANQVDELNKAWEDALDSSISKEFAEKLQARMAEMLAPITQFSQDLHARRLQIEADANAILIGIANKIGAPTRSGPTGERGGQDSGSRPMTNEELVGSIGRTAAQGAGQQAAQAGVTVQSVAAQVGSTVIGLLRGPVRVGAGALSELGNVQEVQRLRGAAAAANAEFNGPIQKATKEADSAAEIAKENAAEAARLRGAQAEQFAETQRLNGELAKHRTTLRGLNSSLQDYTDRINSILRGKEGKALEAARVEQTELRGERAGVRASAAAERGDISKLEGQVKESGRTDQTLGRDARQFERRQQGFETEERNAKKRLEKIQEDPQNVAGRQLAEDLDAEADATRSRSLQGRTEQAGSIIEDLFLTTGRLFRQTGEIALDTFQRIRNALFPGGGNTPQTERLLPPGTTIFGGAGPNEAGGPPTEPRQIGPGPQRPLLPPGEPLPVDQQPPVDWRLYESPTAQPNMEQAIRDALRVFGATTPETTPEEQQLLLGAGPKQNLLPPGQQLLLGAGPTPAPEALPALLDQAVNTDVAGSTPQTQSKIDLVNDLLQQRQQQAEVAERLGISMQAAAEQIAQEATATAEKAAEQAGRSVLETVAEVVAETGAKVETLIEAAVEAARYRVSVKLQEMFEREANLLRSGKAIIDSPVEQQAVFNAEGGRVGGDNAVGDRTSVRLTDKQIRALDRGKAQGGTTIHNHPPYETEVGDVNLGVPFSQRDLNQNRAIAATDSGPLEQRIFTNDIFGNPKMYALGAAEKPSQYAELAQYVAEGAQPGPGTELAGQALDAYEDKEPRRLVQGRVQKLVGGFRAAAKKAGVPFAEYYLNEPNQVVSETMGQYESYLDSGRTENAEQFGALRETDYTQSEMEAMGRVQAQRGAGRQVLGPDAVLAQAQQEARAQGLPEPKTLQDVKQFVKGGETTVEGVEGESEETIAIGNVPRFPAKRGPDLRNYPAGTVAPEAVAPSGETIAILDADGKPVGTGGLRPAEVVTPETVPAEAVPAESAGFLGRIGDIPGALSGGKLDVAFQELLATVEGVGTSVEEMLAKVPVIGAALKKLFSPLTSPLQTAADIGARADRTGVAGYVAGAGAQLGRAAGAFGRSGVGQFFAESGADLGGVFRGFGAEISAAAGRAIELIRTFAAESAADLGGALGRLRAEFDDSAAGSGAAAIGRGSAAVGRGAAATGRAVGAGLQFLPGGEELLKAVEPLKNVQLLLERIATGPAKLAFQSVEKFFSLFAHIPVVGPLIEGFMRLDQALLPLATRLPLIGGVFGTLGKVLGGPIAVILTLIDLAIRLHDAWVNNWADMQTITLEAASRVGDGLSAIKENFESLLAGQISLEEFGSRVQTIMSEMAEHIKNAVSTLGSNILGMLKGGAITAFFTEMHTGIDSFLNDIQQKFPGLSPLIDGARNAFNLLFEGIRLVGEFVGSQFGPAWDRFGIMLSELEPKIGPLLNQLGAGLANFGHAFQMLWEIAQPIIGVGVGLIALGFAEIIFVITKVVEFVINAFTYTLPPIIEHLGGIFEGLSKVIDGALTAVAGIVNLFKDVFTGNWSAIGDDVQQIWTGLFEMLSGYAEIGFHAIVGAIEIAFGLLHAVWDTLFADLADYVGGLIGSFFNSLGTTIHDATSSFGELLATGLQTVISGALAAVDWAGTILSALFNWVAGGLSAVGNWLAPIKTAVIDFLNSLIAVFVGIKLTIEETLDTWTAPFRNWANALWQAISGAIENFLNQLFSAFTHKTTEIKTEVETNWLSPFTTWAGTLWTNITTELGEFFSKLGGWADGVRVQIANKTTEWKDTASKWVNDAWNNVSNLLSNFLINLKNKLGDIKDGIVAKIKEWVTPFIEWVGDIWDKLKTKLDELINKITGWIGGAAKTIGDSAKTIGESLAKGIEAGFTSLWEGIVGAINDKITGALNVWENLKQKGLQGGAPQIPGGSEPAPSDEVLPGNAEGGIYNTPTVGLFGEDGAEAIIPLKPSKRQRALELLRRGGLVAFAEGGIVGSNASGTMTPLTFQGRVDGDMTAGGGENLRREFAGLIVEPLITFLRGDEEARRTENAQIVLRLDRLHQMLAEQLTKLNAGLSQGLDLLRKLTTDTAKSAATLPNVAASDTTTAAQTTATADHTKVIAASVAKLETGVSTKLDQMLDRITQQAPTLQTIIQSAIRQLPSLLPGNPNRSLPLMAEGSVLTEPTPVLAGEDGPEAIIPLDPRKRGRALQLLARAGILKPMADGGVIGTMGLAGPNTAMDGMLLLFASQIAALVRYQEAVANSAAKMADDISKLRTKLEDLLQKLVDAEIKNTEATKSSAGDTTDQVKDSGNQITDAIGAASANFIADVRSKTGDLPGGGPFGQGRGGGGGNGIDDALNTFENKLLKSLGMEDLAESLKSGHIAGTAGYDVGEIETGSHAYGSAGNTQPAGSLANYSPPLSRSEVGNTGGSGGRAGGIRYEAEGDILTEPTHVVAGENGPEAIIPLKPSLRGRALDLLRRTGLVKFMAQGGVVGAAGLAGGTLDVASGALFGLLAAQLAAFVTWAEKLFNLTDAHDKKVEKYQDDTLKKFEDLVHVSQQQLDEAKQTKDATKQTASNTGEISQGTQTMVSGIQGSTIVNSKIELPGKVKLPDYITGEAGPAPLQALADGDILNEPTHVIAGEAGPEAIIPLGAAKRGRALDLLRRSGLVKFMADGGVAGVMGADAGAALVSAQNAAVIAALSGIAQNMAAWTKDLKDKFDKLVTKFDETLSKYDQLASKAVEAAKQTTTTVQQATNPIQRIAATLAGGDAGRQQLAIGNIQELLSTGIIKRVSDLFSLEPGSPILRAASGAIQVSSLMQGLVKSVDGAPGGAVIPPQGYSLGPNGQMIPLPTAQSTTTGSNTTTQSSPITIQHVSLPNVNNAEQFYQELQQIRASYDGGAIRG